MSRRLDHPKFDASGGSPPAPPAVEGRRTWALWGGLLAILAVAGGLVVQKELVLQHGRTVLLELAPVDPRSLMQGDYMVLSYAITRELRGGWRRPDQTERWPLDGHLVIILDDRQVARFVRRHDPKSGALGQGELLLRYRKRKGDIRLGAESFFFQEGQAKHFEGARFGALKVTPAGDSVLVGLLDKDLRPLGSAIH